METTYMMKTKPNGTHFWILMQDQIPHSDLLFGTNSL
jgi:hypothetical protein